ncbi:Sbal_3080 family lipoprotein [Marinobacterium stanieri]|uniref:Sbal_3080 family lipoprotein n=1 Tax=Marinobacterium stanieri TaxID=49186 RepID=UPI0002558402|nr:Sbal_3080 family lipoprotein [Marinobacterium stanieri]
MIKKTAAIAVLAAVVTGCSIQQNVDTAHIEKGTTLCVIENMDVRLGFLSAFKTALQTKGVQYRLVNAAAIPANCQWTASYTARWSWDLALYMSYAEIQIHKDGTLQGKALYDSTRGGANMGKFIDAETKVNELVEALLNIKTAALFYRFYG